MLIKILFLKGRKMLQYMFKVILGKVCLGSRMGKWQIGTECCVILEGSVDIKQRKSHFLLMHWEKKKSVSHILEYFCWFGPSVCFSGKIFFIIFSSVHCTCSKSICKGIRVYDFGNICCNNENIYIWHYLCCQGFDEPRAGWWCPLHLCKAGNKIDTETGDEKPELDRQ